MWGRGGDDQTIRTARLILRPPRRDDWRSWADERAASRDHLTPWEPTWPQDHLTRRAFRQRVAWGRRAARLGRAAPFLLIDPASGAVIGGATLDNIRKGPAMTATLGYWLGAAHCGRGLMTEALTGLTAHAFDKLGCSRIEAGVVHENTASHAVMARVGFTREGEARAYLKIDGRWRDHVLYALLRDDRAHEGPPLGLITENRGAEIPVDSS